MKKALIFLMVCLLCVAVCCAASAVTVPGVHNEISEVEETQIFQNKVNELTKVSSYNAGYWKEHKMNPAETVTEMVKALLSGMTCDYKVKTNTGAEITVVCTFNNKVQVMDAPNCTTTGMARIYCTRTVDGVADANEHYHYITLPVTAHNWTHTTPYDDGLYADVYEEPTCYKEGRVANAYCTWCKEVDASKGWTVLPKLEHKLVYFLQRGVDCKHTDPKYVGNPDIIVHPTGTDKANIDADIAKGYGYKIAKCVNANCTYVDEASAITVDLTGVSKDEQKAFGLDEFGHKWGSEDALGNPCNVTKACLICAKKEEHTLPAQIGVIGNVLDNCYWRNVTYGCTRCKGANKFHRFDDLFDGVSSEYAGDFGAKADALGNVTYTATNSDLVALNLQTKLKDLTRPVDNYKQNSIVVYYNVYPVAHVAVDVREVRDAVEKIIGGKIEEVKVKDTDDFYYKAATCVEDGYYYTVCKIELEQNNKIVVVKKETIAKLGHDWGAYQLVEEHSDGNNIYLRTCKRCGITSEPVATDDPAKLEAAAKAAEEAKAAAEKAAAEAKAAAEKAAAEAAIKNGLCLVDNEWGWYASDALTNYTGFQDVPGKGIFYFTNGKLDTSVLGVKDYNGAKFLASDGKLRTDLNGVVVMGVQEAYWVAAGKIATDFTGIQPYGGSAFYFVNGKIDFTKTGTVNYGGQDYVVNYGEVSVN